MVLLVPLTDADPGLVDAAFLAAMPDGALLVNAARGPVVDTDALVAELASGRISAALDVTDPEPLPAGHPLWDAAERPDHPARGRLGARPAAARRTAWSGDQLRRYVGRRATDQRGGRRLLSRVRGSTATEPVRVSYAADQGAWSAVPSRC